MAFAIAWVCFGVAVVSAVAAAAICLPLPHGHSVFAPKARISLAAAQPIPTDFDAAQNWREAWTQRVGLSGLDIGGLDLRGAQDKRWMPDGGLSMLLATRFPYTGNARLPGNETVARLPPLPPPRPDGIARQDIASQSIARNAPVVIAPQVASLPPQPQAQPRSGERGIFDRLFGDPDRAAKEVLAANPKTVLYDITKRVVYLPDGEKLEAHSGFGQFMDDPETVARKNVGVTPPNIYTVRFREQLFHGVRALRMTPVGDGDMYGRNGILAHSYLLGEAGASNGCISVRDYDKFLQAFEDGKFDRIIVLRSADEPGPAQVASAQGQGA